jgi:hypothetical protein
MTMSASKTLAWSVSAIVLAVVIGGVVYVGSPQQRRVERLDTTRSNDLASLSGYVSNEYAKDGTIPATLDESVMSASGYYHSSLIDPVTKEAYVYEAVSDAEFRLCATFDASTMEETGEEGSETGLSFAYPVDGKFAMFSRHPSGYHCFDVDARLMAPFAACGLRNPCQEGSTCVALPGEPSAVCVPSGYECQAARCASDSCVIAESYPAQVRCTEDSSTSPKLPGGDCELMRNTATGTIACFGCANGICTSPSPDDVPYSQPEGEMGIPYACYAAESGCALAQ